MKTIGLCRTTKSQEPNWDEEKFNTIFDEFCNTLGHTPVKKIFSNPSISDENYSDLEKLFSFIDETDGGFLIVIPDATHVSFDLEGIARAVIKAEKSRSSFFCLEEDFPDILQNAFLHFDPPGVSRKRSSSIKESMQKRAMEGKSLGKPPFGYEINQESKFVINNEEATIVKKIYSLYVEENLGLRKIAEHLNEHNLLTKKGNAWNIVSIRDILKNTSYMGTYTRFGLRLTRNHEPLIDAGLFREAQDKIRERRRYRGFPDSTPYLLSGLCVCGYCGSRMMGSSRKQAWQRQDGTRVKSSYRYYQCQSRGNRGTCKYHTWPTDKLETKVLELLKTLSDNGELQASMEGVYGSKKASNAAEERLRQVVAAEDRFIDSMKKTAKGQSVIARLSLYLDQLDLVRTQAFISTDPSDVPNMIKNWDKHSFAEKQAFLKEYIDSIRVKDRSVKINL